MISGYFSSERSQNELGMSYVEVVLGRIFRLRERGVTIKDELKAGVVHFVSIAFILAVNPVLLSEANYDKSSVAAATSICTGVACILSGLVTNLPFGMPSCLDICCDLF